MKDIDYNLVPMLMAEDASHILATMEKYSLEGKIALMYAVIEMVANRYCLTSVEVCDMIREGAQRVLDERIKVK